MKSLIKSVFYLFLFSFMFLGYGLYHEMGKTAEDKMLESYCTNVRIWQRSNGKNGYAPYKGTEICENK